ncbi:hypothetical protein [Opitutus sp. GAS368]|uniref:hypothetical protein n=1 Tax=Opitutus sp. GAS368 TaxID=1882749 RepID=UPI0018D3BF7A|nr:hypothetical protein [Opitutus sp. GAS368]
MKYISHVAFVEFDRQFSAILRPSDRPIIRRGVVGAYDEHGIFPFHVFRDRTSLYGFISGWSRRKSVPVETAIGLSMSEDGGETFVRLGDGPVLASSPKEPFLVGDPFVCAGRDHYHMWYIFGVAWHRRPGHPAPERTYKIGHAISHDLKYWIKPTEGEPIVSDRLGETEAQALPTVIFRDGLFHMVFCYRASFDFRHNRENGYRLGYAVSADGYNWSRDDQSLGLERSASGWDSEMMCYPHLFELNGQVHLLYNGNAFGKTGFGLAVLE